MSASPAAIAAAAKDVDAPEGTNVVVLYEHGRYRYAEDGSSTYRYHRFIKVLTQDGADGWGQVSASWAPWYQGEPTVRARVITSAGSAHELDPKTIEAAAPPSSGDHMYSDLRSLRAPLPALRPGAVVEILLEYPGERPYFDAGDVNTWYVDGGIPTRRTRLEVDVPRGMKLRYAVSDKKRVRVRSTRRKGRTVWTFDARNLEAVDYPESSLPSDVHRYATVRFSTGKSWNAVARRYERIVEDQIATGGVADIAVDIPKGANRKRVAEALLAQVHDNVRYTGLELGQNAIVPWTPAETWKRKYGDCKDKATLMVALLRRAGVTAHIALLDTGPGLDVHPNLPGLGDFNHAIVVIPAGSSSEPALWMDPTNEFARVGELPWQDQGRWALIVDGDTRKLTKTPAPTSTDNVIVETRRVDLPELGKAHIVETTSLRGSWERSYRSDYRDDKPEESRKSLAKYVEDEYRTKSMRGFSHSDVSDLGGPFELRIEIDDSPRAEAAMDQAWIYLFRTDTMSFLPSIVTSGKALSEPRVHDYELIPHVYEVRYEVTIPAGFEPRALPAAETRAIGPGSLTTSFSRRGDTLYASMRFDTGKPRLTPAELMAMKRAYDDLSEESALRIDFDQVGLAHVQAGRTREGLAALRALAASHPKHGLHQAQIARALLAAGLGDQARAAARRAVAIEPTADTYSNLGWVLIHDRFGRPTSRGLDRAGAIAAYRKAKSLAPKAFEPRYSLGVLLEYDDEGRRYKGDLDAAIAEYRALQTAVDDADVDENLLFALLYAKRWKELHALAKTSDYKEAAAFRVAAAAGMGGVEAMTREARRLRGSQASREAVMDRASKLLMYTRMYDESAAVLREAAKDSPNASSLRYRADLVGGMTRQDELRRPSTPAEVVEVLMRIILQPGFDPNDLAPVLSRMLTKEPGWASSLANESLAGLWGKMDKLGFSPDVTTDLILSMFDMRVEAHAPLGWKVVVSSKPSLGRPMPPITFFVGKERGSYRLVSAGTMTEPLGAYALALARRGKLDGARVWLGWAVELARGDGPGESNIEQLWKVGDSGGRKRIELAAAVIGASVSPDEAIPVLRACPRNDDVVAELCDGALVSAYWTSHRYEQALAVLDGKKGELDDDERRMRLILLIALKRWDAATKLAKQRLDAGHADASADVATIAANRGDLRAARLLYGAGPTQDDNMHAWISLFLDDADDAALAAAKRAVAQDKREDAASLNTLAAVHAARGELHEAYQVWAESLRVRGNTELTDADWVVYGKILAGYGFDEAAAAAYANVDKPKEELGIATSSWRLAQLWRKQLGK